MPLLIHLLILIIVLGAVVWIVRLIPLPPPWHNIALVLVAVIAIVYLLGLIDVVPLGHLSVD